MRNGGVNVEESQEINGVEKHPFVGWKIANEARKPRSENHKLIGGTEQRKN